MITKESLRIGNLLFMDYGKGSEIAILNSGYDIQSVIDDIDNWSAIPLTPEWLEKCGFVTGSGPAEGFIVGTNGARVRINFTLGGYDYFDTGCFIRNLQFVHELQNLFYAINSMELKISL